METEAKNLPYIYETFLYILWIKSLAQSLVEFWSDFTKL